MHQTKHSRHVSVAVAILEMPNRRTNRQISAPIKTIHHPDIRHGRRIRIRQRDADQLALAAIRHRMQHRQRKRIVHVIAHIRIEDDRPRREANIREHITGQYQ